jgi:glycosyltransferase involved in cell wall biosynthesis
MRVSIVIPAFNEERLLPATLASISLSVRPFATRAWEVEQIVCDNNSTDRTAEIAREGGAKVVFEPCNQIARARNRGAAAASGDWLIFIDADSHPSAELMDAVAGQIESGQCLAGGATVRLLGRYPKANVFIALWNGVSRTLSWVPGSFVFCETAAFRRIGGFDERLFASEEIDLSKRLKKLARQQGKRMVILHRDPILTSARKVHLYTPWEHVWFLARTVLAGGRTLTSREACHTWYDGRR